MTLCGRVHFTRFGSVGLENKRFIMVTTWIYRNEDGTFTFVPIISPSKNFRRGKEN